MTNNTNNTTLISAMVLNKYHENDSTTVLKVHDISIDEENLRISYKNLDNLLTLCRKRKKAYSEMHDFYASHRNWKKEHSAWKRWITYYRLTDVFFNYIDMYVLREKPNQKEMLSYLIITNKLTKFHR